LEITFFDVGKKEEAEGERERASSKEMQKKKKGESLGDRHLVSQREEKKVDRGTMTSFCPRKVTIQRQASLSGRISYRDGRCCKKVLLH